MPVPVLGRCVVVTPGASAPQGWADAERVVVDGTLLGDEPGLATVVDRLHRAWVGRRPVVVELGVDPAALRVPEVVDRPPWGLPRDFSLLRERLHFLVWRNAYDLRSGDAVWWWARKAAALGATVAGPCDVVLPDGAPAWIDGGPPGPLDGDPALRPVRVPEAGPAVPVVVLAETVAEGRLDPVAADPPVTVVDGLAPDQAAAVTHPAGPARIVAPAGSGKTRTLVARLRHLLVDRGYDPGSVCAVAYNARAAAEMADRLRIPAARVRTIHSLGWAILRDARGELRLLDEAGQRARLDPLVPAVRRPDTDVVGPYLEALAEVRIALRSPADVEAFRDDVPGFAEVLTRYRERLVRRGEADHDEQIYGAIEALLRDPDLRRRWQGRCRHLVVDEFQDLTPGYLLLLRLVASPELEVFGVGDDDQVIYGYAGADPGFLVDFDRWFPGATSHPLEVNYRSPAPVVEAASRLLSRNRRRVAKTVRAGPDAVAEPGAFGVDLRLGAALGAAAADVVAGWLEEGVPPQEVAVLCRVNSALLPVHAALATRGIPFRSPLGPGVLQRTVLAAVLAWLRLGLEPEAMGRGDLLTAVRRPSRGLNRLAGELLSLRRSFAVDDVRTAGEGLEGKRAERWFGFCDDLAHVAKVAAAADTAAVLRTVVDEVGLSRSAAALDAGRTRADRAAQSDDLVALRRVAAMHRDPATFEAWLREVVAVPHAPDGVLLSTVHRVKGMEWRRVVVFGADDGLLPHRLSADREEERRVFHVAITRGRERVVVLAERDRPSPFLDELDREAPPMPAGPPVEAPVPSVSGVGVEVGDRIRLPFGYAGEVVEVEAGGVLVRLDGGDARLLVSWGEPVETPGGTGPLAPPRPEPAAPDPELFERLRAWRLETARTRGVPAYVVFADRTLEELARRRPTTEAELLAVPGIGPAKLEAYGDDLLDLLG